LIFLERKAFNGNFSESTYLSGREFPGEIRSLGEKEWLNRLEF
jgi:hypothetical protein